MSERHSVQLAPSPLIHVGAESVTQVVQGPIKSFEDLLFSIAVLKPADRVVL